MSVQPTPLNAGPFSADRVSPQNDERASALLECITDGFAALDPEWRYTYVNQAWAAMSESNCSKLLGQNIWQTSPQLIGTAFERALRTAAAEKVSISFEDVYVPTGRLYSVSVYLSRDEGIIVYARDMSDRKHFQEELLESEERFHRYFELGLIGMAITSPTKGCIEVNDEICRILGYDHSELLQTTWAALTYPDDLAADVANFQRVIAGEIEGYSMDKRWIRKDRRVIQTTISVRCVRNPNGTIAYFLALLQDITARKHAEEALLAARNDLEERVAERTGELVAANAELTRNIAERERAEIELQALKNKLAAELLAMQRLHDFSTRLLGRSDLQLILEDVLEAVMVVQGADFGDVRLYDQDTGSWDLSARRGLDPESPDQCAGLHTSNSQSWRAMGSGTRVLIEDALEDERFLSWRDIAVLAGFRALHFTPLFSRSGGPLGVLSTYFREPRQSPENESHLIELYARYAAEAIERKRSVEQQRKLASIVENSLDFVGMASMDGHAQIVNLAGRLMVGLDTASQVRQTQMLDYVVEEQRENLKNQILPVALREGKWEGEVNFRHFKTGAAIPMLQNIFVVRDQESGRPVALGTIARDLRKRKRGQQALREAQAHLAHMARVTTAGEMAATIAHEINQPLTAVVTSGGAILRWLRESPPNLMEARIALEDIVRQGHRASEVIARIRAMVRKGPVHPTTVNLNQLVDEVLALTREDLERHGMKVRTELDAELPAIFADPVQIQQVLLNLILNAIDATIVNPAFDRDLLLTSHHGDHLVFVAVHDYGIGIDPSRVEELFAPFFTTKPDGIGLGLAISRSIIESHGGRMWARANPSGGAVFQFSLPVEAGEANGR